MLYPYSKKSFSVLKFFNSFSSEYEISAIVAPTASGLIGKDAAYINNVKAIGMKVEKSFKEKLDTCEAVLLCESDYGSDYDIEVFKNIQYGIKKGKNIICLKDFSEEKINRFRKKSLENQVLFQYFGKKNKTEEKNVNIKIFDIACQIIFISELVNDIGGEYVFYEVNKYLKDNNYIVAAVGANNVCNLLGLEKIPEAVYDTQKSFEEKVLIFNHFIHTLSKIKPDYIVIQLPGGIMKYNEIITNNYGYFPFLLTRSFKESVSFLVTDCNTYNLEFYKLIYNYMKYHLGTQLCTIIETNEKIDLATTRSKGKLEKICLPIEWKYGLLSIDNSFGVDFCENAEECYKKLFYDEE